MTSNHSNAGLTLTDPFRLQTTRLSAKKSIPSPIPTMNGVLVRSLSTNNCSMRCTNRIIAIFVGLALALPACGPSRQTSEAPMPEEPSPAPAPLTPPPPTPVPVRRGDSQIGRGELPKMAALLKETPIESDTEWPHSDEGRHTHAVRLGYLRQGARVSVLPEARRKPNCPEGWYELADGGFVCGRHMTMNLNHPRVRLAPHPPYVTAPLPYEYGYNTTNGTPLYRTIPSREERLAFEPWLSAPQKKRGKTSPIVDAGALANGEAADAPWYLRDLDGGKPQVTLDDLKGEGPIERRMVKGFYLALDKALELNGGATGTTKEKWWQTTRGFVAPYSRIYVQPELTDFHGVWLSGRMPQAPGEKAAATETDAGSDAGAVETASSNVDDAGAPPARVCELPDGSGQVAFVLSRQARKYTLNAEKKRATPGDPTPRFTVARLTGNKVPIGGRSYVETVDGWWLSTRDITTTDPGPPPKELVGDEKWIDINLSRQTLVAFEGTTPVYATVLSSGKRDLHDKEKDHGTVTGSFRIREKHVAATMDGDVASDGPYSIEDVPWIMYFKGSYALHGAFWHALFGRTKSHGCVNLAPRDAHALFDWTGPHLPAGWHGVYATTSNPGTRVVVHD